MTTWIAIAMLVAVLGGAAALMVPAYLRQRIEWKRTPGGYYFHAIAPISVDRLDQNISLAFLLLREHSDFDEATLIACRSALRVRVQRVREWESPLHGGKVAGVAGGTLIDVGSDLAALCHEIAHACEFIEGGADRQDASHASWPRRGIQAAVDEYEQGWVR